MEIPIHRVIRYFDIIISYSSTRRTQNPSHSYKDLSIRRDYTDRRKRLCFLLCIDNVTIKISMHNIPDPEMKA